MLILPEHSDKPVWLLLPTPADFRWLEGREDSPWYPTMRLFRQRTPGQWDDVIERVGTALADSVAAGMTRAAAPAPSPIASPPRKMPTHCRGLGAVAETRHGIVAYLPDEAGEGVCLGYYGEWLQLQLDWLTRWVRPGMTILELGASVGAHALWMCHEIGPQGHAVLFESDPLRRRILRQNLAANGMGMALAPDEWTTVDELRLDCLDVFKLSDASQAVTFSRARRRHCGRIGRCFAFPRGRRRARAARAARGPIRISVRYRVTPLFNRENFNRREDDVTAGRSIVTVIAIAEEIESGRAFEGATEI